MNAHPDRIAPGPGQESVWDYPRPPRPERCDLRVEVWFAGQRVADTSRAFRILETSHPPTFYIPFADLTSGVVQASPKVQSFCEFKGVASYWDLIADEATSRQAGWSYPTPSPAYADLLDHICFYPSRVDRCVVAGETVQAQEGDFYGGWITSTVVGPFKGAPGTRYW